MNQTFLCAQKYYTSEPQKDSIVINLGKNSQEIKYIFYAAEPSLLIEGGMNEMSVSSLNPENYITPEITIRKKRSVSDLSNYGVGSIPIQSGVTPTGGKTYSIPIQTVSGYHLVPNIALEYNSQFGNGIAGYGWSLSGISFIKVRNKTLFYESAQATALYSDATAVYSLDGVPIVMSENLMNGYELATSKGNIQIHKHQNSYGTPAYFDVLYPDGGKAVFGYKDNLVSQVEYPLTEYEDIEGNKMIFEYSLDDGSYYIKSISYGKDAKVTFTYSSVRRQDSSPYRNAVAGKVIKQNKLLLRLITVKSGTTVLYRYTLTQEYKDYVNLLKKIDYESGVRSLPPIEFEYGIDIAAPVEQPGFTRIPYGLLSPIAYVKSSDVSLLYKRGKIRSDKLSDGLVVLPNYPNYGVIGERTVLGKKYKKYGSLYSSNTKIQINSRSSYGYDCNFIEVGDGFQCVEILDVNGDGVDEIVKVNNSCSKKEVTDYKVTIYSLTTGGQIDSSSFSFSISDGTYNKYYNNPAKSGYYFGDFRGDGKMQLLIMTYKSSRFAFIDLNGKKKLSETTLFSKADDDEYYMFVADMDGKGKSDFCLLSSVGLKIYQVQSLTGTTFVNTKTYSSLTRAIAAQSMTLSSTQRCRSIPLDVNGDGYMDIVSYLEATESGITTESDRLNVSFFNGETFVTETSFPIKRRVDSELMFLDVDKDGLPDILNLQKDSLFYVSNNNGYFEDKVLYANVKVDSTTDLISIDMSTWNAHGDMMTYRSGFVDLYSCNVDHGMLRKVYTMTDSFGNWEYNAYSRLGSEDGVFSYDRGISCKTGFINRVIPIEVIKNNRSYSGNQTEDKYYCYTDAIYNNQGLGFCGFRRVQEIAATSGVTKVQTYNAEKFGVPVKTTLCRSNSQTPYLTLINTYDSYSTTYGKLNPRLTRSENVDAVSGIRVVTSTTYDSYGYPTLIRTEKKINGYSAQSTVTRNKYAYIKMEGEYVLGVLLKESIDTNLDSVADSVWRVTHQYDREKWCHPTRKITVCGKIKSNQGVDYSIGLYKVSSTKWEYDSKWNIISEKSASYNSSEYVGSTYTYDADGRFLLTKTDPLGRVTRLSDYTLWGKPTKEIDYNSMEMTYSYDQFGNLIKTTTSDGAQYESILNWGGAGLYTKTLTGTDKATIEHHFNAGGLEVRTREQRFDNTYRITDKVYDVKGRLQKESLPYKGSKASYWTEYSYDDYDRVISKNEASGRISTWSYNGTSITSKIEGLVVTKMRDALGNIIMAGDGGGMIRYTYRDDGQIEKITAPGNVLTTFEYDKYGRRIKMIDPSAGVQSDSYTWNTDGTSSSTHTNSNGWVRTQKDKFGRLILTERSNDGSTSYSYDDKGRLIREASTNGCITACSYDSYGRIQSRIDSLPGGVFLKRSYGYRVGGQVDSIRYESQEGYMATECYQYQYGNEIGVKLSNGTVVRSLSKENVFGQSIEIYTNGLKREYGYTDFGFPLYRRIDGGEIQNEIYEFDPQTGNLLSRSEYTGGPIETFAYDNLNRLTRIGNRTIGYSLNGNIARIDGVGHMRYTNMAKPYQITSFVPDSTVVVGGNQRVMYSCYNRPLTITEGENSVSFIYDADGNRVRMEERKNGSLLRTHWYVGDKYEFVANDQGYKEQEILYLGGDAYNAPLMWRNGSTDWQIGRDYLGSIKQVVAPDGALSGNYSYDPWGRLRSMSTLEVYAIGQEPKLFIGRGYTGHEHLPQFGLINMNARLYDPLLGRFLSPDPYVQAPDFTQNLNRYSYALNNPLKYTDESGEVLGTILTVGALIGATFGIGNLLAHNIRGDDLGKGQWAKYFFSGFGAGFILGAGIAALGSSAIASFAFLGKAGVVEMGILAGLNEVNFAMSAVNGIINGNDNWFNNYVSSSLGKYYLDENKSFWGELGEGLSRYTWEVFQQTAGYAWTSLRNGWNDRVDLWGGATFSTNYWKDSSYNGVTLGSFININYQSGKKYPALEEYSTFNDFMKGSSRIKSELYKHEYGHTIQSKKWGVGYLPVPAMLSLVNCIVDLPHHDSYWTEIDADSYSSSYFEKNEIPF